MRSSKAWRKLRRLLSRRSASDLYHRWYYDEEIWNTTSFLGVPCLKSVSDLWNYQEILMDLEPSLVVEFGTWHGGSALYFAVIMEQIRRDFRILTVDVDHTAVPEHLRANSNIEFLTCSSTDSDVAHRIAALREQYPGPVFATLDSLHEKDHVLAELLLLREVVRSGDYVIVEDSNVNGHPVLPNWGEGPMEAVEAYEAKFPADYRHDTAREGKFGFTFAPNGFLVRR